jgi:hypothetical protein
MKRVLSSVITVVISFCLVAGFTPAGGGDPGGYGRRLVPGRPGVQDPGDDG